eukprot:GHVN01090179.1.p1 GENE.GHVN01090179.1~~GHVN01090179.1.p1  ORF type:complete len:393 (+),score=131.39 GHVN01090179.1:226-1404(+)
MAIAPLNRFKPDTVSEVGTVDEMVQDGSEVDGEAGIGSVMSQGRAGLSAVGAPDGWSEEWISYGPNDDVYNPYQTTDVIDLTHQMSLTHPVGVHLSDTNALASSISLSYVSGTTQGAGGTWVSGDHLTLSPHHPTNSPYHLTYPYQDEQAPNAHPAHLNSPPPLQWPPQQDHQRYGIAEHSTHSPQAPHTPQAPRSPQAPHSPHAPHATTHPIHAPTGGHGPQVEIVTTQTEVPVTVPYNPLSRPTPIDVSDDCQYPTHIEGTGTFDFDTSLATTDGPNPSEVCNQAPLSSAFTVDHDVWFCWRSSEVGSVIFHTCDGTHYDTVLQAFGGCRGCPVSSVASLCSDDLCGVQSGLKVEEMEVGSEVLLRLGSPLGQAGGLGRLTVLMEYGLGE